jgi:hypothetical protein
MEPRSRIPPVTALAPRERLGWPELPAPNLLGLGFREEDNDALAVSLPDFLSAVYEHAVFILGEDEAKALFVRTVTKKRGERGPGRQLAANRDAILLQEYGRYRRVVVRARLSSRTAARIPRLVAEDLHRACPGRFGSTPEAIEKQIRRLLRKRQKPLNNNSTAEASRPSLLKLFGDI